MDLKGKVATVINSKTTVDIIVVATGKVHQHHDVEGKIGYSASLQRNIAAIAVYKPYHGVHLMDLMTGVILHKFMLPHGRDARVALSKNALIRDL